MRSGGRPSAVIARRAALSAGLCALGVSLLGALSTTRNVSTSEPFSSASLSFTADDGIALHASLGWFGSLSPRPLIVEDSPYAPAVSTLDWSGDAFNYVELQWRGTGLSGGSLDSTGARDQQDLSEFLAWACNASWSNGNVGLYGFSASAIVVYNAMHELPTCVRAASLMSGTVDLYRDLLSIGGVPSPAVGLAVEGLIGEPWFENLVGRAQQDPSSVATSGAGFLTTPVQVGQHTTEDSFWAERTFQGDPNHIPVLADDGWFDVEERGAVHGYEATKADGSHLLFMGAHDGSAAGTPGPFPHFTAWFDQYLLGQPGTDPVVSLELANGSRQQFLAGNVTPLTGSDWPLPGTTWSDLYLSPAKSGSATSLNDGTLTLTAPAAGARQSYPFVPSIPSETDVHTTATIAGDGLDQLATALPALTDMELAGPGSLTYTTPPLQQAVDAVGPVGLDLDAASTAPYTDLVAVIADVWPDGTAYPVATGWLRTSYPGVDLSQSTLDPAGEVVDPYNDFSATNDAPLGATREYHVEVLPIGDHFAAGHRIRLYVLGTPFDMEGAPPGLDTLSIGGATLSRIVFPTYGTTLASALGQ
ncbi:MAG: CocE/NonD family hydrolase [Acidimicrobiales bacterium]